MKYSYPLILLVLAIMTAFSYLRLNTANNKIEKYDKISKKFQNDSENYLSSLTNFSAGYSDSNFILETGDTINFADRSHSGLFFFFSSKDCMTCVEENIFELIKLAKAANSIPLYILTTKENRRYIELLSRANDIKDISYGFCMQESQFSSHHYFYISENGEISNTYYPKKGSFGSTKRYLKDVRRIFCTQDSCNRMYPK
jgi:hypothetical protein